MIENLLFQPKLNDKNKQKTCSTVSKQTKEENLIKTIKLALLT